MDIESAVEHIKKPAYKGMIAILYATYIATYFGLLYVNPEYIQLLSKLIRLFICVFLIIRFNPFRSHHKLREFDGELIFASAILLLTDLGITQFVVDSVKKRVTWSNVIQEIII